ncbi:MAG: hypothetical protein ABI551_12500 [Polyangiaceae bacterium]
MSFEDLLLGNYKTVVARLGLTLDGALGLGHVRIYGILDGIPIQMYFGPHSTHTTAPLTAVAPVDLSVATKGIFEKIASVFHERHQGLGDEAFDKVFSVESSDPKKVAALVDYGARKTLLELADEGLHPAFDAHAIHLRRFSNGGSDSEASIERHFRETVRLARSLGAAFGDASV